LPDGGLVLAGGFAGASGGSKPDKVFKGQGGLYEVLVGGELYYVDAGVNFVIAGRMFDSRTREDLAQKRLDTALRVDLGAHMNPAFGGGDTQKGVFLQGASFDWRPSQSSLVRFEYRDVRSPLQGGWGYGGDSGQGYGYAGPVSLHTEYMVEKGAKGAPSAEFVKASIEAYKRDLGVLKEWMGWTA